MGIVDEVDGFLRRGVCGHYYNWARVEGCRREVSVIHEGDVREDGVACCEV